MMERMYQEYLERIKRDMDMINDIQKHQMALYPLTPDQCFIKQKGIAIDISKLEEFGKFLVPELSPIEIMDVYTFVRNNSTPLNEPFDPFNLPDQVDREWNAMKETLEASEDTVKDLKIEIDELSRVSAEHYKIAITLEFANSALVDVIDNQRDRLDDVNRNLRDIEDLKHELNRAKECISSLVDTNKELKKLLAYS